MNTNEITIPLIHKNFVPRYDRWHGKLTPIVSKKTLKRVWDKMEESKRAETLPIL